MPDKKKHTKPPQEVPVPYKEPEVIPENPKEEPLYPDGEPEIRPEKEPQEPLPPEFPPPEESKRITR